MSYLMHKHNITMFISQNSVSIPNAYSIPGVFWHSKVQNLRLNLCVKALLKASHGTGTTTEIPGKPCNFDLAGWIIYK